MRVTTAAGLAVVRGQGVNLALWHRPAPSAARREAARLLARAPFCVTVEGRPGTLGAALSPEAPLLAADIARLAAAFAAMTGTITVHGRLEALTDEGCRLFHADAVGLRLLCTYAGAGTEWVPEHGIVRGGLRRGDNAAVVPDRRLARRLAPFTVGVFKGDAFPGNAGRGLVHRSSPGSVRAPRLLLCLDEPGRF
ncbi:DUF1826 domain-containing protein [Elioraea sp.]|uniref:DUF1826 domain-containing protein n=1 Tax=Elioraea sp. TaxID=2185103 RepID=UPI0025BBD0D7|nr:DUF1826 domain-containing protein [Elioraea sp.]